MKSRTPSALPLAALPLAALPLASLLLVACNAPQPPGQAAAATLAQETEASDTARVASESEGDTLAHGRYIVRLGGCNDCHTPGYAEAGGEMPTEKWLMGSTLGWHGPWGTTYPANLRLKLQDMDEAEWIEYSSKLHTRPPMPDFAVRGLNDRDRIALFRFIKSLGPGGEPAPTYLPPGQQPPVPYVDWVLPPAPVPAPESPDSAAAPTG